MNDLPKVANFLRIKVPNNFPRYFANIEDNFSILNSLHKFKKCNTVCTVVPHEMCDEFLELTIRDGFHVI